jgi:hypothetical protein
LDNLPVTDEVVTDSTSQLDDTKDIISEVLDSYLDSQLPDTSSYSKNSNNLGVFADRKLSKSINNLTITMTRSSIVTANLVDTSDGSGNEAKVYDIQVFDYVTVTISENRRLTCASVSPVSVSLSESGVVNSDTTFSASTRIGLDNPAESYFVVFNNISDTCFEPVCYILNNRNVKESRPTSYD